MKLNTPKGTRDFSPEQMARRNYIFDSIRKVFEQHGYLPIETPAFENSDTLMGKYGEEGDRLIFKILDSGDFASKVRNDRNFSVAFQFDRLDSIRVIVLEKMGAFIRGLVQKEVFGMEDMFGIPWIELDPDAFGDFASRLRTEYARFLLEKSVLASELAVEDEKVAQRIRYYIQLVQKGEDLEGWIENDFDELFIKGPFVTKLLRDHNMLVSNRVASKISEKALRYDLTVPFARYVVQHRNGITFPFKRYQIQPVWRADRPQKGRYREFYQCDVDVIGSNSLLNEVDLVMVVDDVFSELKIPVTLKLNNRKLLAAIAEVIGEPDRFMDITVALDKLDKIGEEKVMNELSERGIPSEGIEKLRPLMQFTGDTKAKLEFLVTYLGDNETGKKGLAEVTEVIDRSNELSSDNTVIELDLTLARGLNYYTGAIFEVKSNIEGTLASSITGGGRYDDLTGIFGLKDVSGVGISFGADRIYDVMLEANLFPDSVRQGADILFINFGEEEAAYCLKLVRDLQKQGIRAELFPDSAKMKKQMNYANNNSIPWVAMVGSDEMKAGTVSLKNMESGEQETVESGKLKELIG